MDVKYLTYILAIAQRKNMTKAAEELYVSQSSLSQYLAKLEQELGTPLFYRTKGELLPTPAGHLYIAAAKQVIQIKKQLYKDILALDRRGHITVGTTSQFGLQALSEIIPIYKAQYPEVSIEITEGNYSHISRLLLEEQLDLAIMASHQLTPFETQSFILRTEEVLLGIPKSHPYHQEQPSGKITLELLQTIFKHDNFLLPKKGSSLRGISDEIFSKCNFIPSAICETNSISTIQSMIAKEAGIGLIASSCTKDDPNICYHSFDPPLSRLNLLVFRQNWSMNQAEQAFCQCIQDYFCDKY